MKFPVDLSTFFLLGVLSACGSASVQQLSMQTYPPKPSNCELEVFTDVGHVERKYREIALISVDTGGGIFSDESVSEVVRRLRTRACQLGADAVVLKNVAQGSGIGEPGKGTGIAIKLSE